MTGGGGVITSLVLPAHTFLGGNLLGISVGFFHAVVPVVVANGGGGGGHTPEGNGESRGGQA